jgi:putative (di)nucleoside polyphosphate hydrolase
MTKAPLDYNQTTLAELLADPIVQMVMKADRVTERQLIVSITAALNKLSAGSVPEPASNSGKARAARDYRPNVGIMLLNANNEVFVGRRSHVNGEAWQMPQGGIEEGEEPRAAAFRELKEEIGVESADIIAETKSWLFYDFPPALMARHQGWRGQRQKWFAMRFNGRDADINIATEDAEFCDWKWVGMEALSSLIVSFKRLVYLSVLEEFMNAVKP